MMTTGGLMLRCLICRFEVELDDAIAPTRMRTCICLRCYLRETKDTHTMTDQLRRWIADATMNA